MEVSQAGSCSQGRARAQGPKLARQYDPHTGYSGFSLSLLHK
jgi:hypothetical protein